MGFAPPDHPGANRLTLGLDATLAVSEQVRESMSPRPAVRTEVLIHGVDVDAIAARRGEREDARAEHGLPDDDFWWSRSPT